MLSLTQYRWVRAFLLLSLGRDLVLRAYPGLGVSSLNDCQIRFILDALRFLKDTLCRFRKILVDLTIAFNPRSVSAMRKTILKAHAHALFLSSLRHAVR